MSERVEELSESEVTQVLQFAQSLYNGFGGYGFYTPFTQNQNLLELNNNPKVPTYDKIAEALESAPYDYALLSSYSEFMEVWDTIYAKTFRYLESLLSFDLTYSCKNIKNPKTDYKSKEYEDDLKRVHKFLDNFDYKQEFKKVVKEILRKETSYVWFRDSHEVIETPIDLEEENSKIKKNEKFSLQIMPQKYCMLTGYFNSSQLLYDFNINYFLKGTVDINLFAPSLKKKFKDFYDNKNNGYNPSSQLDRRNGEFATWAQCSPNEGAYAFKMDLSNFRQVPPFANLMKSAINNDVIQKLQIDKDIISAYLILAGEIQIMDGLKSGDKKDQFSISPKTMGQFMNLVTSGLKKNVKPAAFPLTNIKGWQYNDQNPNMANNNFETTANQGVSASSMVYTTGKMAQFEMENAILADYNFMKQLYLQFNQFMNFFVNKKTVKYKFEFEFEGLDREFYRDYRTKRLREYADKGIVLDETQWASALGIKPQTFHRSLECAHYSNFTENLTMLLNANTMKDGANPTSNNEGGAPQKDNTEIKDSGSLSHEYQ